MQIDHLQIELRPRTNSQALDLGFALLRSHAGAAYKAYLALWLPLVAGAAVLTWGFPHLAWCWALLIWWCKPLLERAPLYVLSRQVFGTTVTWQEAVRAWPRQLGGGWFRLLTWGRPFAHARSLAQPVWQLENARGAVASARRRVLGRQGTLMTAFFFGFICFVIELMLVVGIISFIGLFVSDSDGINPFVLLVNLFSGDGDKFWLKLLMLAVYATATAIMAPIYTACGFTLYLNRRASLEAWDLELQLRQIAPPAATRAHTRGAAAMLLACLMVAMLGSPPPANAADAALPAATGRGADSCRIPAPADPLTRTAASNEQQARARREVDALYATREVHGWICTQSWTLKEFNLDKKKTKTPEITPPLKFDTLASILKVTFIAAAIGLVAWLMYRYRDKFGGWRPRSTLARATEVGGLDIRAESLPDDITATVRALWAQGQRRGALALLYRATLSRLVSDDGLLLTQGNTEGDCLRLAHRAAQEARLGAGRLQVATATTAMWLDAAYAGRWLDSALLEQRCTEWDAQFGPARSAA
ncbi:hypothetical protein [Massilia sp. CF038]|uniref:hypothetical protein n=1 Tax=Massilia sp. CF038 TaxID=1881045 RepID=UPI000922D3E6|nr:hypothetical protein [Massilia sp. CF038]SHH04660.1 hypothetical protein SAMN05428948_2494 [Massilia sp. CF038]